MPAHERCEFKPLAGDRSDNAIHLIQVPLSPGTYESAKALRLSCPGNLGLSIHDLQDTIGNQAEALVARPPRLDDADRLRGARHRLSAYRQLCTSRRGRARCASARRARCIGVCVSTTARRIFSLDARRGFGVLRRLAVVAIRVRRRPTWQRPLRFDAPHPTRQQRLVLCCARRRDRPHDLRGARARACDSGSHSNA
jgi:hypothetical protein